MRQKTLLHQLPIELRDKLVKYLDVGDEVRLARATGIRMTDLSTKNVRNRVKVYIRKRDVQALLSTISAEKFASQFITPKTIRYAMRWGRTECLQAMLPQAYAWRNFRVTHDQLVECVNEMDLLRLFLRHHPSLFVESPDTEATLNVLFPEGIWRRMNDEQFLKETSGFSHQLRNRLNSLRRSRMQPVSIYDLALSYRVMSIMSGSG